MLFLLLSCSDYKFIAEGDVEGADSAAPRPENACSAWDPGPDYTVETDPECMREPLIGIFDPVIEWQWSANPVVPGYDMNMATPVVGSLTDDDLDGDVDGEDTPEIVFTSYTGSSYSSPGTLTAVRGDSGETLWSFAELGGVYPYGSGGVAVGDLEGDGRPDVCVAAYGAAVLCVEGADGAWKWAAGSEASAYGHPAIADLDGDGLAEVIFGRQIFAYDGTPLSTGAGGTGGGAYMSFAVDWDGDGQLEVVAGSDVYRMDGTSIWSDGGGDGYPAVGDLDGDGAPDMIRASGGYVRASTNAGALLWETAVPGGGGGAPTVADFDGDGQPEVGVAGYAYYTLFDTDGSVLWSNGTEDDSSSVTGSSVFDFEGDGRSEVVYADEHNLYVYDGATGAVLLQQDGHASGTLYEYPVIADVDGDGATEIVVSSNDMWWEGWRGVTVIGSASGSWAPARPVWNQFAYHITNIEDDGSVPAVQVENWLSWNNFRAGGTELGPSHWMPNLRDGRVQTCLEECAEGRVEIAVSVENNGLLDAAGVTVSLRRASADGPEVASSVIPTLAAGGGSWTGVFTLREADWPDLLYLVVDAAGEVEECDELDNSTLLGFWPCA